MSYGPFLLREDPELLYEKAKGEAQDLRRHLGKKLVYSKGKEEDAEEIIAKEDEND